MIQTNKHEEMLTEAERAILAANGSATPDAFPLVERPDGAGWSWAVGQHAAARAYPTREAAASAFAAYRASLEASARAESERQYDATSAPEGEAMALPEPPTEDARLLSAAITASGRSVRRFASEILVREPRTVWRWLAGENALPGAVRTKCQELLAEHAGETKTS